MKSSVWSLHRYKTKRYICCNWLQLRLRLLLLLLQPFNSLFSRTTWYQKGKTSLDLNDIRDNKVLGCSGVSWTICKQSAPWSRQITTPARPHHWIFTGPMLFLTPNQQCQSTQGMTLSSHEPYIATSVIWQATHMQSAYESSTTAINNEGCGTLHKVHILQQLHLIINSHMIFSNKAACHTHSRSVRQTDRWVDRCLLS